MGRNISEKIVDFIFDPEKGKILGLFILGVFLRLISARNLGVSADDVNHAIRPIGIFGSGKLVWWDQSTSLWYYIQGVFYKFFGPTQLGSKFAEVLFGSLLIILVYLFVKRVFKSERVAFISSFLIAISPMIIKSTLPEMDVAVSFFTLLGAYFLWGYLKSDSTKDILLCALVMGLAIMIKLYALFFAVSFVIFILYKKRDKRTLKRIILFGLIIFILIIPTVTHNYLLYKDKGFVDFIFSNSLKIGTEKAEQFYSWGAGWLLYTDYRGFLLGNQQNFSPTPVPGFLVLLWTLIKGDLLLVSLGLISLPILFKKHRDYFIFVMIVILPAFVYLGAQIPMAKHFVWMGILISPGAGLLVKNILEKIPKIKLKHVLLAFLIFNLFYLGIAKDGFHSHFYSQSGVGQVMDFKEKIPADALIVTDSRIYRGTIHWALNGKNYLEASQFFPIANELNKNGNSIPIEVYYIECVKDDCGWGTVSSQPDFNQSMEEITLWFANSSVVQKEIFSADTSRYYIPFFGDRYLEYRIYKTSLLLSPDIFMVAKQTHVWFLMPIGYDRSISAIFDDYSVSLGFDSFLNSLAWFILYTELFLVFVFSTYVIIIFIKK